MGKRKVYVINFSVKKLEENANWAIEDKGNGDENPFTKKKQEKKLNKLKEEKKRVKNVERNNGTVKKKDDKLKNDKKQLDKTLEIGILMLK
jgi:hypothetical protein